MIGKEEGMNMGVHELLVAEYIDESEPVIFRFNLVDCLHHKLFLAIPDYVGTGFTHLQIPAPSNVLRLGFLSVEGAGRAAAPQFPRFPG